MVKKVIFGYVPRINGTLDNHFTPHGSSVYDLYQIHEILLCLKAANKFSVIWRAGNQKRRIMTNI